MQLLADQFVLALSKWGRISFWTNYGPYAIAGGALVQLAHDGNIELQGKHIVAKSPPSNETLAVVYQAIANNKPRTPSYWINKLTGRIRLRIISTLGAQLAEQGVIQIDTAGRKPQYYVPPASKNEARQRMIAGLETGDEWIAINAAIAGISLWGKQLHPDRDTKRHIRRLSKQARKSNVIARAVDHQVMALQLVALMPLWIAIVT